MDRSIKALCFAVPTNLVIIFILTAVGIIHIPIWASIIIGISTYFFYYSILPKDQWEKDIEERRKELREKLTGVLSELEEQCQELERRRADSDEDNTERNLRN